MTERQLREKVINIMRGWIGCKQGDKTQREIIATYNKIRPLPLGYRMTYKESWCAATISAAGYLADLQSIIFPHMNCGEMIRLYRKAGRWVEDDAYTPIPGDIIMYYWKDNGVGDCRAHSSHVGMVEKCDGEKITVIEGNMGANHVCGRRTMQVNGRYIRGFCCPDYASLVTEENEEDEIVKRYKTIDEIPEWYKHDIQELIDIGALRGDKDHNLDLTEDMIRCLIINKRYNEYKHNV